MNTPVFSPAIEQEFQKKNIHRELTLSILDRYNRGDFSHIEPIIVKSVPEIDGKQIIDLTGDVRYSVAAATACERLSGMITPEALNRIAEVREKNLHFTSRGLQHLGMLLLPYTAFGILNGGSASSYIDEKKNRSFSRKLYDLAGESFAAAASQAKGKPKGISPAFTHPDGTPGPSFLELKIRSLLLLSLRYRNLHGAPACDETDLGMLPLFQMTSAYTDKQLADALKGYSDSPLLQGLEPGSHPSILSPLSAQQPLIAAYTHSNRKGPKRLFTEAWGKPDTLLPLPGGHGQNFAVLADIYRRLYRGGKRFAYLGNIDNLGNTIHPVALALFALSGGQGAFEFSYKTAVDIKGGILIRDQKDRLSAADIGPAIPEAEVLQKEQAGIPILFNCATGLFDLRYFSEHINTLAENLPVRFSDQNKDAGMYSQAEQITWEVIGMLEKPLIFAVNKYRRFLASKLLLENLMTSGVKMDDPGYPEELKALSRKLHDGLQYMLTGPYGLNRQGDRWVAMNASEVLKKDL